MHKIPLAFVDHSFHKKTNSGNFLRDIFSNNFDITDFWDESWENKNSEQINTNALNRYSYIFYFQVLHRYVDLKKINSKIIWAPMYDSATLNPLFWKKLSNMNIKIICFSKKIFSITRRLGLESFYVQFYKEPEFENNNNKNHDKKLKIFFWYRGNIKFNEIKKYIDPKNIKKIIYLSLPDPGYNAEIISREDIKKFNIDIIQTDFLEQEKYIDLVSSCDIFISPRLKEGIGMSFIEAIAKGKVVMAYNDATMNEYIEDRENGYLFPTKKPIDFSDFEIIERNSRIRAIQGWNDWQKNKQRIIDFTFEEKRDKKTIKQAIILLSFMAQTIKFTLLHIIKSFYN